MMNILIIGSKGKMGSLTKAILEDNKDDQVFGYDQVKDDSSHTFNQFEDIPHVDVIIDFSHPKLLSDILTFSKNKHVPLVIATTGFHEEQTKDILKHAQEVPVFMSANYAYGVAIINKILKQISDDLSNDFDIEIIEKHHAEKKDAPSGTSLQLAQTINDSMSHPKKIVHGHNPLRESGDLGIHSVRAGSIVGEHTILFSGKDETIEITHRAQSKKIFALGAIKAMHYIIKQNPGLYTMEDLLKEQNDE